MTTSGTINPIDLVDVGAQVSGKIVKLYADYNSPVKAGQIVAEIDPDISKAKVDQNQANYESSQARLEQAKVTLDNTKKKYDRTLDLFQRNLVSFEEKETAESNYLAAKVGLQTAHGDRVPGQVPARLEQGRPVLRDHPLAHRRRRSSPARSTSARPWPPASPRPSSSRSPAT